VRANSWSSASAAASADDNPKCQEAADNGKRLAAGVLQAMDAAQLDALVYPSWNNPPRLNMAEFAWSPFETVGSLLPGYTRNPYALDRVPAGSSGGTRPSPPILALSGWAPILAIQSAGHRRTPAWSASARRWG
jgi:hypothetical protein